MCDTLRVQCFNAHVWMFCMSLIKSRWQAFARFKQKPRNSMLQPVRAEHERSFPRKKNHDKITYIVLSDVDNTNESNLCNLMCHYFHLGEVKITHKLHFNHRLIQAGPATAVHWLMPWKLYFYTENPCSLFTYWGGQTWKLPHPGSV